MTLKDLSGNPANSAEIIGEIANKAMMNINTENLQNFIKEISNEKISKQNHANLLNCLAESISKLENKKSIPGLVEIIVQSIGTDEHLSSLCAIPLANALKSAEEYRKALNLLQKQNPPEGEFESVDFHEHIAELLLKLQEWTAFRSKLFYLSEHIFRLRTPEELIFRFDIIRAENSIHQEQYLDAARTYIMILSYSKDPEINLKIKQSLAICLILNTKRYNSNFLVEYAQDNDVRGFKFYPMIELMVSSQFIDQKARDDFLSATNGLFPIDIKEALDKACLQHNLMYAENMFKSVRIEKLAQLIGFSPIDVEKQIIKMIVNNQIDALIDQGASPKLVIFNKEKSQAQDDSIIEYSKYVTSVIKAIKN